MRDISSQSKMVETPRVETASDYVQVVNGATMQLQSLPMMLEDYNASVRRNDLEEASHSAFSIDCMFRSFRSYMYRFPTSADLRGIYEQACELAVEHGTEFA